MASPNQPCFNDQQFHRFLDDESDSREEARILAHISNCQSCQAALENLAGNQEVWAGLKQHLAEDLADDGNDLEQQRDLSKIQEMLAPTDHPEMLGRLGRYEVSGVIGRGSAGIVLKALDTRLNRFVAIKLLAPVYSNNGCARRRFEREGRAIASVKDPHVVPIHTVDEYQGAPYIVMQYLPDGSLHQRIQKHGPLKTTQIVCIGMQIAKGLAAAHARGIVHRDVKPANVLLENGVDGAMVTDFGLARVVDEATMTRSGSISGTPQFMSPEQAQGVRVDPRSDLFSLGSVMYAACTGHAPFKSTSVFGVIKKVCEQDPTPIGEHNPETPSWLVAFIAKLHSKDPKFRFDSASEVAELLANELAYLQAPAMVANPDREWWIKDREPLKLRLPGIRTTSSVIACIVFALVGVMVWKGKILSPQIPDEDLVKHTSGYQYDSHARLVKLSQENNDAPKFKNLLSKSIDVKPGGTLFLRTNLGKLIVSTHDKPTVDLKILHSVSADNQEMANKLFEAARIDRSFDTELPRQLGLNEGEDAAIVVNIPTQVLTEEEIDEANDLRKLKDQLLIRNNSHFRNAEFEIKVPKNFNLDLETQSGPMRIGDLEGSVKLHTVGGNVVIGSISGDAEIVTRGGEIDADELGGNALLHASPESMAAELKRSIHAAGIWANRVGGNLDAFTAVGNIEIIHAEGEVSSKTLGGNILIWKAEDVVQAESPTGTITVNFVDQPKGESSLVAGIGFVKVGYFEGLDFEISAESGRGKITSPFHGQKLDTLSHRLNNGQNPLKLVSRNDRVRIYLTNPSEIERQELLINEQRGRKVFQAAYQLHVEGLIDQAIEGNLRAAKYEAQKALAYYNLGCEWALKRETDKAFAALEDAVTNGLYDVAGVEKDPDLESIRADERYAKLVTRLKNLPANQDRGHNERIDH